MLKTRHNPHPILTVLCLAAPLVLTATSAGAAMCSSYDKFSAFLSGKYKESPRAVGLVANKRVMQIYVSEKGTWSILMTSPQGTSCLIAAGDNWEKLKVVAAGPSY